jgi:predicted pyridoxine 5'-phosphate oxidase superfamily flavin-nucleotide-binding protein
MNTRPTVASDVAFSSSVKAVQARKGSREAYARMEQRGGWRVAIDEGLKAMIEAQTSVFLATASADGQPTIQHRGGPAGFLHVLDEHTIAFADFAGNRQYISQGNLAENDKAMLFLIDYADLQRVKVWGRARVVEGDAELLRRLMPDGYRARGEQVMLFEVTAWDANCSQHIPQRFDAAEVQAALKLRDDRIAALEAQLRAG